MTREQKRAQTAYHRVKDVPDNVKKEYGGNCLRLPALIHQNGLCQTLAFLEAKAPKGDAFRRLLDDLAAVSGLADSGADLAAEARKVELGTYQRFTREALASATYLKRYAEAVLRAEVTDAKRQ